jgi:hypothetical protein
MSTAKNEVRALLDKLPDDCTLEDVQYHLYVAKKVARGIERAKMEGTFSQDEVEKEFNQWNTK